MSEGKRGFGEGGRGGSRTLRSEPRRPTATSTDVQPGDQDMEMTARPSPQVQAHPAASSAHASGQPVFNTVRALLAESDFDNLAEGVLDLEYEEEWPAGAHNAGHIAVDEAFEARPEMHGVLSSSSRGTERKYRQPQQEKRKQPDRKRTAITSTDVDASDQIEVVHELHADSVFESLRSSAIPRSQPVGAPLIKIISEEPQDDGSILKKEQAIDPYPPIDKREGCGPTGRNVTACGFWTAAAATFTALVATGGHVVAGACFAGAVCGAVGDTARRSRENENAGGPSMWETTKRVVGDSYTAAKGGCRDAWSGVKNVDNIVSLTVGDDKKRWNGKPLITAQPSAQQNEEIAQPNYQSSCLTTKAVVNGSAGILFCGLTAAASPTAGPALIITGICCGGMAGKAAYEEYYRENGIKDNYCLPRTEEERLSSQKTTWERLKEAPTMLKECATRVLARSESKVCPW
jgi:hypothetical protein